MKEYRLVRVSASDSYGRGVEYGRQAADEVRMCVATYREHMAHLKGITWETATAEAMGHLPLVEAALPPETEMLRGVSEGSGVSFEDIMVLNTRYEILHYPRSSVEITAETDCTTYALLRTATADKKVYIGQNWDQRPMVMPHSIVLHITMEDGTKIMGLTEGGQLLRNGLNSHGIGLVASSLNSSLDRNGVGIPGNFMRMRALRSKSFAEIVELVSAFQRTVANNYCVASAPENSAVDIEGIPGTPCHIHPEGGIVTHANHILCRPELDTSKGKKFRGERLGELLRQKAGVITPAYIKQSLCDHEGYPDSICSHIPDGVTDLHKAWMTVASMLYNLDDLEMNLICGLPCEGEFKTYRLEDY